MPGTLTAMAADEQHEERETVTFSLPREVAEDLEAVARAEGITPADVAQQAVEARVAAQRRDRDFRDHLRRIMSEDSEILRRLAQ